MKKIAIILALFLLPQISLAASLYPYTSALGNLHQGELKHFDFVLYYQENETINMSVIGSNWVTFPEESFYFSENGYKTLNYSIKVPAEASVGSYQMTLRALSDKQTAEAVRTFNVLSFESSLKISYEGLICPGKGVFFHITDVETGKGIKTGTLIVYTSDGEVVNNQPIQILNGYTQAITIPKTEKTNIMVKAESDNYESVASTFQISANCGIVSEDGTGNNLYIVLPETNYEFTENLNITPMIKTNFSSIENGNCIFTGPKQGLSVSGKGGFCNIEIDREGEYILWAEKSGYLPSDIVHINVVKKNEVIEPIEKEVLRLSLLVNGYKEYEKIRKNDRIVVKIIDENGGVKMISGRISLMTPSNRESFIPVTYGVSEGFEPIEEGKFSLTFPEMNETSSASFTFEIKGFEFPKYTGYFVIPIILLIVFIVLFKKRKKGKVGFSSRSGGSGEEFLASVRE